MSTTERLAGERRFDLLGPSDGSVIASLPSASVADGIAAVDAAHADLRDARRGRPPGYIRTDPDVRRLPEYFFEHDLPVGTVCHGPQVPAVYGVLRDRRTAAFGPLAGDMENAGATVVDAPDVVDGNMVSCRGWP